MKLVSAQRQITPQTVVEVIGGKGCTPYVWIGKRQMNGDETYLTHIDARQMDALCRHWQRARK